jgi:4-guanidinobutyraldehyde dehydrogenase/NAD-dependent aldehyde dehydrogenase
MCKPIRDASGIDIPAIVNCIARYAEAIHKIYREVAPTSQSALALITGLETGPDLESSV